MDQSSHHTLQQDDHYDEWDTDGFVIPSFGIESPDHDNFEAVKVIDSKTSPVKDTLEHIYLGPHGAPPQPKQQEQDSSTSRKQRFKQKLKEADKRSNGSGRENKVETLKELIGGSGKLRSKMTKGSSKEWLDPHCDESMFNRLSSGN